MNTLERIILLKKYVLRIRKQLRIVSSETVQKSLEKFSSPYLHGMI